MQFGAAMFFTNYAMDAGTFACAAGESQACGPKNATRSRLQIKWV